jgi:hypothetical protein
MSAETQPLWTRRAILVAAVLVAVFAALLALQGRPAWCKFGVGLWAGAWTHCTSQHFLDPYTLTHALHGILFFWLLVPLAGRLTLPWRMIAALVLEVAWELLENSAWVIERYRQQTAALDYFGDSVLNAMGDVLATLLGFALAARVSWKAAAAVFIVSELLLLYVARDNLTLNIVMLLFPLESLQDWQLEAMPR